MTKYKFLPYEDVYPVLFEKEKERLRSFLGPEIIIEHLGSTAVPGLGGKGNIDIYVAVEKEKMGEISQLVQSNGYEYKSNAGIDNERIFHKRVAKDQNGVERTYHLHVISGGSEIFKEYLAFRNYLRKHPEEAQRYAEVKEKAAEEANRETNKELAKNKYQTVKGDLVKELTQKALQEFEE